MQSEHCRPIRSLLFCSVLLLSVTALAAGVNPLHIAAMGQNPTTCANRYDGPIVSFNIVYPGGSVNPLKSANATFKLTDSESYNVTFVIHTPGQSSGHNSLPGTTWYSTDAVGYSNGTCINGVGHDQNVTVRVTLSHPANEAPVVSQTTTWGTFGSFPTVSYVVDWTGATGTDTASSTKSTVTNSMVVVNSTGGEHSSSETSSGASISPGTKLITPTNIDQFILWFIGLLQSMAGFFA